MKKIEIKIPDKCGRECICFDTASKNNGSMYFICRAFNRVLESCEMYATSQTEIERCLECKEALQE